MSADLSCIEAVLAEALEIAAGPERVHYLDRACGGDAELRAQVESLLALHGRAGRFLEPPTHDAAPPVAAECPEMVIGPYRLLEPIGEGGMGTVYMTEQSAPVRRRVALKVVKAGMDSKQVVARFEAERQALALMDHPNIARVFDGGMTASGRPYFVMELVRGLPITDYCDRERLTIRDRLDLFVLVCRAVQHAHQKGIIHRDLKPSNVLVTVIDGAAVPKVIDFGVAKATGQALTDRSLFTGFHQFVGTPLYMSPEQAAFSGVDVDTRSDVYSLGVLLYELLTGTTPFDAETLRQAAFDELRRILREEEPPRPSERLSTLDETLTTVSARRKADPRRLGASMEGELDWVVMKALEKDRCRRYETANDFAADVMRHLADKPVEACPPSPWYRFSKYARRNRVVLATVTLMGLALVLGTGVSLWQAGVARKAQRRATAEAAAARRAQRQSQAAEAIAHAVNDFLQKDLLGKASEVSRLDQKDANLTVKEALDRASSRIGQRFRDHPLVEAAIRTTIGKAYRSLNQNERAVPHLERALALQLAHLGKSHPDTLDTLANLSDAYQWSGRTPESLALLSPVVQSLIASLGPIHPEVLGWESRLVGAYQRVGQWEASQRLLEELLERQSRFCGPSHPLTLGTMHQLALNANFTDQVAESLALHDKLLRLLKATNGDDHETTIWPRMTFAVVCLRAGDLDRADQLLREALELHRSCEDNHERRLSVANTLGWQAMSRLMRHEYAAAESLAREAASGFERLCPENYRRYYWVSVLGAAICGQRKYAEAETLLLRAYEGMKRQEAVMHAMERRRLASVCQRLVHFYELTQQPEKVQTWREVLTTLPPPE